MIALNEAALPRNDGSGQSSTNPHADGVRTLDDLDDRESAQIAGVDGPDPIKRRLLEMGLCRGTRVELIRRAPLGDPLEFKVHDYTLSLRSAQAELVRIHSIEIESARGASALEAAPVTYADADSIAPGARDLVGESIAIYSDKARDHETIRIALLGNPNSGKTTLFNALSGLRQRVANYAGVTTEKRSGSFTTPSGRRTEIIDLPGTYSLTPLSPDEQIAVSVLRGERVDVPRPDAIVVVVDSSNLARNLYLVSQAIELGLPMVIALTMADLAERNGLPVDAGALERQLGVPVVALVAHRKQGLAELGAAIDRARIAKGSGAVLPNAMNEQIAIVAAALQKQAIRPLDLPSAVAAQRLLTGGDQPRRYVSADDHELANAIAGAQAALAAEDISPMQTEIEARYAWIAALVGKVRIDRRDAGAITRARISERIDRWLVHPTFGFLFFIAVMGGLFVTIFSIAGPLMDATEAGIQAGGAAIAELIGPGLLHDLFLDGIVAGVGAVLVFVPQIALLFLLLALLEDSGYLARAAFLMDRILGRFGLHGKSFIPLLSSHACAIPGIMAARSIEDPRDRLVTIFVAPFMSCSARLPVYYLLIGAFFAAYGAIAKGLALLGLYLFGMTAAVISAWIVRATALKASSSPFILEMTSYKTPQLSEALRVMWKNSAMFVRKAGKIILAFTICLWALLTFPRMSDAEKEKIAASSGMTLAQVEAAQARADSGEASEDIDASMTVAARIAGAQVKDSYAGRFGQFLEPAIKPMGYDWKIGVGLIGAFAAREVFVSTMGVVYSVGEVEDDAIDLADAIKADKRDDGTPLWTWPVAASLLVFFALAMQCISTMAVVKKETGTWRWPLVQLVYMNVLAYILATLVYQIGTAISGT